MSIDNIIYEQRKVDHQCQRRVLASAYNGDFSAELICALSTSFAPVEFSHAGDAAARLWYILEGKAEIQVKGNPHTYVLQHSRETRGRLILPPECRYEIRVLPNSTLVCNAEQQSVGLNGIVGGSSVKQAMVRTLFERELAGFAAKQLKFIMPFDQDVILGGHYHDYREAYSMLRGNCTFRLEDIGTKAREEVHLFTKEKSFLTISPQKAHLAKAEARSILVGFTAEAFQGADSATPYKNDWLLFEE